MDHSGERDPGHEAHWNDLEAAVKSGAISVSTSVRSVVGYLVHVVRPEAGAPALQPPADGWFPLNSHARVPPVCPMGLPAAVEDPDLSAFALHISSAPRATAAPLPPAREIVSIVECWTGPPVRRLDPPLETNVETLFGICAMCAPNTPRFDVMVSGAADWAPPEPTAHCAVIPRPRGAQLGLPPVASGWSNWTGARDASRILATLPNGAEVDVAFAVDATSGAQPVPHGGPGSAVFCGTVQDGVCRFGESSMGVPSAVLHRVAALMQEVLVHDSIQVESAAERDALNEVVQFFSREPGAVVWDGDRVRVGDNDFRRLVMLLEPVFKTRFASELPS